MNDTQCVMIYLVIFFLLPLSVSRWCSELTVSYIITSLLPVLCKIDRSGTLQESLATAIADTTGGVAAGRRLLSMTMGLLPATSDLRRERCSTSFTNGFSRLMLSSLAFLPYNCNQQHTNDASSQDEKLSHCIDNACLCSTCY